MAPGKGRGYGQDLLLRVKMFKSFLTMHTDRRPEQQVT